MEKGSYKGRRFDFHKYVPSFFNPFLFGNPARARQGCGATALSLLTGVPPERVAARSGGTHYSDLFMTRFLRERGFKVLKLTLCDLSSAPSPIQAQHVILASQLIMKNEGTWLVIFKEHCYHNYDIYSLEALSFLNKPLLSAYLVFHPSWRAAPRPAEPGALDSKARK